MNVYVIIGVQRNQDDDHYYWNEVLGVVEDFHKACMAELDFKEYLKAYKALSPKERYDDDTLVELTKPYDFDFTECEDVFFKEWEVL